MKHIIIVSDTQERLQGVVRGIEALDTDHNIAIMHGIDNATVDDIVGIIAEVAKASLLLTSSNVTIADEVAKKNLPTYFLYLPEELEDRDSIISYMKTQHSNIVEELQKI